MERIGIDALREAIVVEFGKRDLGVDGDVADGVSHLVACMISERTPNLMALAEALPRSIGLAEHRYLLHQPPPCARCSVRGCGDGWVSS
jgi:hypothetical protein